MSPENVKTLRRFVEATVGGDYQAAVAELGPSVEIDDTDIPESTGTDSFKQWLARWNESWDSWRIEDLEFVTSDEDKVLALFRMIVKGKESGIELSRDDALLGEFQKGKVVRLGYYNDQTQALEAAGLSE